MYKWTHAVQACVVQGTTVCEETIPTQPSVWAPTQNDNQTRESGVGATYFFSKYLVIFSREEMFDFYTYCAEVLAPCAPG